jgi:hypothetical protein
MKALAAALLLFAIQPIDIDTTKLENGKHYAYKSGDRDVTVAKDNDITTINVVNGERVDTLIVRQVDGRTIISHTNNGLEEPPAKAEQPPLIIDGMNVDTFLRGDAVQRSVRKAGLAQFYVCPKDRAMLRVVNGPSDAMFKCPVDGTLMRPGVGPSRQFYLLN